MEPRSIPCLFIALLGLFVDAKTAVPLDAAEGQDRLRAPLPLAREPLLAFGVEFEYIFPEAFATVSEQERYRAVADALDNVLETRPIVYDDYFSAHGSSDEHPTTWKVVPDASLVGPAGGFEVVSPILTDASTEMKAVLDAMRDDFGAELSETTDFHVHVDVTGRSMDELRRVYKHFIAYERALDSFQPPNHRINQNPYLRSIRELFTTVSEAWRILDACTTLECLMTTVQPGETEQEIRSYKLNLAEHSSGSTSLEFRGHHGTLDSDTARHWIRLVTTMVTTSVDETCASVPPRDGTLQEMLDTFLREGDSAKSHTAREAFYEKRIQMLNAESEKAGSLYARKVRSLDEIFGAARELGGGKRGYGKHYRGRKGGSRGGGGGGVGRRSGSSRGGRSDRRRSSSSRGGSSGR